MINKGDIVELRPSLYQQEFNSFNWSDKYLYEDQFHYVALNFENMGEEGELAKTIFGSSQTRIQKIELDEDGHPFVIVTDCFSIFYPGSSALKEITIHSADLIDFRYIKAEKCLIDELEFFEQSCFEKMFSIKERENNKNAMYKYGLFRMIEEGKWKK